MEQTHYNQIRVLKVPHRLRLLENINAQLHLNNLFEHHKQNCGQPNFA